MKLRIISDGTPQGTFVSNADNGDLLEGVVSATWSAQAGGCMATIALEEISIDVLGKSKDA